ncbi:hypothetical protein J599_2273 [Acinetobacter baumannii 1598530]|uniref:hypothetical protein n=1 Tax=Acinetobacter baumannii TaxID=470 RepID=UPI000460D5C8|nr:hypothetical protein [Acinetobacter baumannii]KCY10726.1 hypothetical protein J599_2273 [Acinetobacter baumannii 1598530]MDC5123581.1 hypothetical protein [Acinetobacter baumannii]MDV7413835.1 hypothetical protein [Acinetobacter baumannii]TPV30032.1 hypothetical protein FJV20_02810 [Acinetobacter baumannii]CAI3130638.1 hypothetical protein MWMV4_MWMV4_01045 [Acinetobacter baumannii]
MIESQKLVESISLIANICTILGFIIALITLIYLFLDQNSKKKLNTRRNFLKKISWSNEGDIASEDLIFFSINIENSKTYKFYGNITTSNYSEKLTFYFEKAYLQSFTIRIHKNIGWRDVDLARAKIKMITPDLFEFTLLKGFEQDNFEPDFPYKTKIW